MRRGINRSAGLCVVLLTASLLLLMGPAFAAADGDLDRSFSGDGKQTTDLGGAEFAEDVAIQPNGKIVVLVSRGGPGNQFALIRYNADGSLDPTFSANGIVTAGLGGEPGQDQTATALALQGAKIVVAGYQGSRFAVTRFTRDGVRDPTFAGDGTKTISFVRRRSLGSAATAVAIDHQRRIVVAGDQLRDFEFAATSFAVARLTPDGTLDHSFSHDGKQLTDFLGYDSAQSVAVTRNGGVVVGGSTSGLKGIGGSGWAIARYRPDGRLDRSFFGDGKRLVRRHGGASGVAVRAGRIVAVGTSKGRFALTRLRRDGTLDRSFAGDGHQFTSVHPEFGDIANDLVIQRGGKIVVAGRSYLKPEGDPRRDRGPDPLGTFTVARYLGNGRLDRSFSGDGKRTLRFGAQGPDAARGLAVQDDGRIVVAGADAKRVENVDTGLFPRHDRGSRPSDDIAVARFKG